MNVPLFRNILIERRKTLDETNASSIRVHRVLWIDLSGVWARTIDIDDPKAFPVLTLVEEIEQDLITQVARVLEKEPDIFCYPSENAISPQRRQRRDAAWEIIAPLVVDDPTGAIYDSEHRGPMVEQCVELSGKTKTTIYSYLRRYWQGGQVPNALLPQFNRCGAPGKLREAGEKKRGRPRRAFVLVGAPEGINVTEKIRKKLQAGVRQFYKKDAQRSLELAFQLTLETYFNIGHEAKDGVLTPILLPPEERPTLEQFRYWCEKENDAIDLLIAREGQRHYNATRRSLLGSSTQMASGPGSVYQIDATLADVYLVSATSRGRIIGRPVLYLVMDVFSHMIVGFYVGMEAQGWTGAGLAVDNAVEPKVPFCKAYGRTIEETEWPCHHPPQRILADRGEFEGYNADQLVNGLGITVSNTPPYRGDLKGLVEGNFNLANARLIKWLPGAVQDLKGREGKDYRLDACLTVHEFCSLLILLILRHNHSHEIKDYPFDRDMMEDGVRPIPIELWNWGVRNRVGQLRVIDRDIVRFNLLPTAEATVTEQGIRFEGLYYLCELALEERWFAKARRRKWKVPIAYEPRLVDQIYLRREDSRVPIACQLVDHQKWAFQGLTLSEVRDHFALEKQKRIDEKDRKRQSIAEYHAQVEATTEKAIAEAEAVRAGLSKSEILAGIKEHGREEKRAEQKQGAWRSLSGEDSADHAATPQSDNDPRESCEEEGYVPPQDYSALLGSVPYWEEAQDEE